MLASSVARSDGNVPLVAAGAHGAIACSVASTTWQASAFDDRSWTTRATDAGTFGCATTRYERWHFAGAATSDATATALLLRVRYQHGFAAYLNGVEIARRRLDPNATLANEVHGLEIESITIPLTPGLVQRGDNVLAIEAHARTMTREPLLEVELTAQPTARVVRGPYLQNLRADAIDVIVDTDLPTSAELMLSRNGQASVYQDKQIQRRHVFALTGLNAATHYTYRVTLTDEHGTPIDLGNAAFHTPPEAGRAVRFVLYGDVRSGHDIHALLNRAILDEDPDFVLMTGDLVDQGSDDAEWQRYFEVAAPLLRNVVVFPAPGNHEYARMQRGRAKFYEYFRVGMQPPLGYVSETIAGMRFIAIDSNEYKSTTHLDWLVRELADAKRRRQPAFVFAHEGPYSTGLHGDNQTAINFYVPVLEKYNVALMMYGHDHHYERGKVGKLNYLVSGGGGAELRAARCSPGPGHCLARVAAYANEHHYVVIEIAGSVMRVCPKRVDGSAIEPCASYTLPYPPTAPPE